VAPVAASAALRPLLGGAAREGVLLGAGERGAWARFGDEVVVIGPAGAVRLPNGIELPPEAAGLLRRWSAGEECATGGGAFQVGGCRLQAVNEWDPRPALPSVRPEVLRERAAALCRSFTPVADEGLAEALVAGHARGVQDAAARLIGKGPGLTPLGDDILAGALAASRLLAEAAGRRTLARLVGTVGPALCAAARERTTALAATLLRHAWRGEVDQASAGLLAALCGRGHPEAALGRLLTLGHSSGAGLATGALAGASAAGGAP